MVEVKRTHLAGVALASLLALGMQQAAQAAEQQVDHRQQQSRPQRQARDGRNDNDRNCRQPRVVCKPSDGDGYHGGDGNGVGKPVRHQQGRGAFVTRAMRSVHQPQTQRLTEFSRCGGHGKAGHVVQCIDAGWHVEMQGAAEELPANGAQLFPEDVDTITKYLATYLGNSNAAAK